MSDASQGPGWWLASDGRWYPPESAPPRPSTPPTPPGPSTPVATPNGPQGPPATTPQPSVPPPGASGWGPPSGPGVTGPPSGPPTSGGGRAGWIIPVVVGALAVVVIVVVGSIFFLGSSNDDETAATTTTTEPRDRPTTTTTSRSTTTSTASSGLTPYRDDAHGFSISTPSSWQQVSVADPAAQDALDRMLAQNPQMSQAMGDATSLAESGIVFLASDPLGGSTVNVVTQDAPGAPATPTSSELEGAAPDFIAGLEATGATVSSHEIVTIGGRPSLSVAFTLPLANGGAEMTLSGEAYVFVTSDTIHVVTIIGRPDVIDQVISTFSIG